MSDLIKTDLYKMTKSKLIIILFCVSIASAGLMVYFSHLIAEGNHEILKTGIASLFADSQIFTLTGCIITGIFFCNDFECKIIENAISSGHSRRGIVTGKMIFLVLLVTVLAIPYIAALAIAAASNLEVSVYIPSGFLSITGLAASGASAINLVLLVIVVILTYSAQLSMGVFILFLSKKPVITAVISYIALVLLGPISGLNETTKNIMAYTPFGVDYKQLSSDLAVSHLIGPISIDLVFIIIMTGITALFFRKAEVR